VLSHGLLYISQNAREMLTGEPPRLLCYDLRADLTARIPNLPAQGGGKYLLMQLADQGLPSRSHTVVSGVQRSLP